MKKLKLTPTSKLTESEWQSLRQTFTLKGMVGGSDAGTLLGWNKWKSPISMYYQALGLSPLPNIMNIEMAMGKMQEDNIADSWQYWDGEEAFIKNIVTKTKVRKYKKIKAIIENPKYPNLFANIDGLITQHPVRGKKKGILEIKKINGMTVDTYIGGIPPQYIAQVQHYMLVCDLEWAELCMRVDGRQLLVETIDADFEIQSTILNEANKFQERVSMAVDALKSSGTDDKDEMYGIAAQFEPDADASDDFNYFISEKHKLRDTEVTIQGSADHQQMAEEYKRIAESIKEAELQKQLYQNKLKQVMEKDGASIMQLPEGKITWRKSFLIKLNK
jgi:predicted phage-related endonuclease